ncbi:MAG: SDR family NAD(P)-dependent oxidoreductase [Paracoccaceae bacterium]|nr:SDR family NAD(P)-dependent oxidoreductase [Paracoccaceae bacterium]
MAAHATGGSLEGARVLVTGGSRGIAAAIALSAAASGAHVAMNHCSEADRLAGHSGAGERLIGKMKEIGGRAVSIDMNLSGNDAGRTVVRKARRALGGIDCLVLSASIQVEKPFVEQTRDDLDQQLLLNLRANIAILQATLPGMAANRYGRVLSIGSVQEVAPSVQMPVYTMTKAAMKALIEGLALEYAPQGVTLNTLSPGLIATDRNERHRADAANWESIQNRANPMGRAGMPAELVPSAILLLSPESAFITGATLYATGGAHIQNSDRAVQLKT